MINEYNTVCKPIYVHEFGIILNRFYSLFQNCKHYVSILYTFELLDVEHGSPISHKNVNCNSLARILQYAITLVMAQLPCFSQLHLLPIIIFDNLSK